MGKTLVTIETDGFRDFVTLPDGRQFNLGSVSVLKLVSELVPNLTRARVALNAYLKNQRATVALDLDALAKLVTPKRSRWAGYENPFIAPVSRTLARGASTMTVESQIDYSAILNFKLTALERVHERIASSGTGTISEKDIAAALHLASHLLFTHKPFQQKEAAAVDRDALRELNLYLENEGRLDKSKKNILTNILRKQKADKYDPKQAPKLWLYWVDEGASMYAREFGGDARQLFPRELRQELAEELAKDEAKAISNGDYSHIKVASADEALGEVNETLADRLMSKVEAALMVVTASKKANTFLAQQDLHTVATRIAAVVREDLSDPTIQPTLLDLSSKVEKIHTHFA